MLKLNWILKIKRTEKCWNTSAILLEFHFIIHYHSHSVNRTNDFSPEPLQTPVTKKKTEIPILKTIPTSLQKTKKKKKLGMRNEPRALKPNPLSLLRKRCHLLLLQFSSTSLLYAFISAKIAHNHQHNHRGGVAFLVNKPRVATRRRRRRRGGGGGVGGPAHEGC